MPIYVGLTNPPTVPEIVDDNAYVFVIRFTGEMFLKYEQLSEIRFQCILITTHTARVTCGCMCCLRRYIKRLDYYREVGLTCVVQL